MQGPCTGGQAAAGFKGTADKTAGVQTGGLSCTGPRSWRIHQDPKAAQNRIPRLIDQLERFQLVHELVFVQGLGQVAIAQLKVGIAHTGELVYGRGHDNFHTPAGPGVVVLLNGADLFEYIVTVQLGHHDVQADEIVGFA